MNNSKGYKFKASQKLFKLVKKALKIANESQGYFDPTIIDFLETYGYGSNYDFDKLKNKELIQKEAQRLAKRRPSYKKIELSSQEHTIKLAPKQRIDLGAIAKGYAIDLAYQKLEPLNNYLINAGGDIRARGSYKKDKGWIIKLKSKSKKDLGYVLLDNQAICSSGSWARKVKFFHHLINP